MCDILTGVLGVPKLKTSDKAKAAAKPATRDSVAVKAAEDAQRRRVRNAKGRSATVLTRPARAETGGEVLGR